MDNRTFILLMMIMVWGALGVGALGTSIGKALNRRAERNRPPAPPEPICGCTHHLAFHDPETGECRNVTKQAVRWERDKKLNNPATYRSLTSNQRAELESVPVEWSMVQCPCQRYTGPEVLATIVAPEIAHKTVTEISPNTRQNVVP